jgi:hypothetical protein
MDIMWSHFVRGTPTDDTSQPVLIFRLIVAAGAIDGADPSRLTGVVRFDRRPTEWPRMRHAKHKHGGGLGRGAATFQTASNPSFARDPIAAARAVWELGGRQNAAKGSSGE